MAVDFNLNTTVDNYAVFGNPIAHSQSPKIHSCFAKQSGITLSYQAIEVPLARFDDYAYSFLSQSGKGFNITVPFKEAAYAICTQRTARAQQAGVVNTIWADGDDIYGDTTDGQGFINDLTINHHFSIKHKSVLVLGAGGAVSAIINTLSQQQPECIVIANRTIERAIKLVQLVQQTHAKVNISACHYNELATDYPFDLIINGTTLSLQGQLPPLPELTLNKNTYCYDLVYAKQPTCFMDWATAKGANKALDGYGMLVEQAAESFLIWHGIKPATAAVIATLKPPL